MINLGRMLSNLVQMSSFLFVDVYSIWRDFFVFVHAKMKWAFFVHEDEFSLSQFTLPLCSCLYFVHLPSSRAKIFLGGKS